MKTVDRSLSAGSQRSRSQESWRSRQSSDTDSQQSTHESLTHPKLIERRRGKGHSSGPVRNPVELSYHFFPIPGNENARDHPATRYQLVLPDVGTAGFAAWHDEPPPLWVAPYDFPRLPVEVWERVIDQVANLEDSRSYLLTCTMVCNAWVPRARFHLCGSRVLLRSSQTLDTFAQFLRSSPHELSGRVTNLVIKPHDRNDQTWVSTVPICLPRLPNMRQLTLEGIDFSQQNVAFWKLFTLITCQELSMVRILYSRHLNISRLVSAVQPQKLALIRAQLTQGTVVSPGHRLLSCGNQFKRLESILMSATSWDSLTTLIGGWSMSGQSLSTLHINGFWEDDRAPTVSSFTERETWDSILHMFLPPCRERENALSPMELTFNTPFISIRLQRTPVSTSPTTMAANEPGPSHQLPAFKQILELAFSADSSVSVVLPILRYLSEYTFVKVVLHVSHRTWHKQTQLWKVLDDVLSSSTPSQYVRTPLGFVDVVPQRHSILLAWPEVGECPRAAQVEIFAKCTSRGIFRTAACGEWKCSVHREPRRMFASRFRRR
ncbi:hypothetical protein BXZ70DRAFT_486904 [Cristinia sonorae]|uniref:F-box domain-containing protein n=1 Tax=Cristinia sonorae TaxID=1940300 RepID=A0A8K0XLQ5_9AGAR|nr:hypothetical protein BXZ70DRAFT_486904 [Cristinia sonorae]